MGGIPVVTLEPSGHPMPLVGMGTAVYPFAQSDVMRAAIHHAIRVGYRHFDTAAVYQSEQPLGEAIAEALRQGLVKSRDELFVTTKLWCSDAHRDLVVPALRNSLSPEDLATFDMASVWEAMEQCHHLGLAKAIGVSNFSCKKLELLLGTAKIPPAVNQVEMSPVWQQRKLREFCAARGIHISAYSPLGASGTPWGSEQVMGNRILREIAEAKGKTVAQVCLRWVYEQKVSVLVKSFNTKRLEENLDILDWELNEDESHKISQIPQHKAHPQSQFCSSDGQYKSPEELWDGEI